MSFNAPKYKLWVVFQDTINSGLEPSDKEVAVTYT